MNDAKPAAAVLALEAAAAAVTGVGFAVAALVGHPSDRGTAVLLGVLLVAFGAGLATLARGIALGRRWARTPAFLAQFFGLVVAWNQHRTLPAVAIALGVVCLGAVATLVRASRTDAS
jgi:hypothetical protein